MKSLQHLYTEHTEKLSDKWTLYLTEYDRLFAPYLGRAVSLLEIGIQNGGSLAIWGKYFPDARVLVGCDINPDCAQLQYDDQRISVVVGDANTDETQSAIQSISQYFDLVIDDGSHTSSDIVRSFARYFPRLNDDGLFVAEDMHCSYWQEFDGGLKDPLSSISFFKCLADVINHEHWGLPEHADSVLEAFYKKYNFTIPLNVLAQVHSIEFVNSMCVVRKCPAARNTLGTRYIAGDGDQVVPGLLALHGSRQQSPAQDSNVWRAGEFFPRAQIERNTAELASRATKIAELQNAVQSMQNTVQSMEDTVQSMLNSYSWRVTAPLRRSMNVLRRGLGMVRTTQQVVRNRGGVVPTMRRLRQIYSREGIAGFGRTLQAVREDAIPIMDDARDGFDRNDYAEWARRYDTLDDNKRKAIRDAIQSMPEMPLISVIMPTYNPRAQWLIEAIESVQNQLYPNWELCIADDASPDPEVRTILQRYAAADGRIKLVLREQNGHISAASNSALGIVSGAWIALLDHDDMLAEHALYWVADAIISNADLRLIYSDEDKIDDTGRRRDPYFKCDWNQGLFYSHNLISHLGVYRADVVKDIGGFRVGYEGSQDYDLAIRFIERIDTKQIHHIPRVLYHWRVHADSTAALLDAKPYAVAAGEKALNEHFQRQNIAASAIHAGSGYRVNYRLPEVLPLVTIIIPTRNGLELVRQCIDSIIDKTTYPNYEIVIVDNGSDDPEALAYFRSVQHAGSKVKVIRDDAPFNYSAINNKAVKQAKGDLLALLNNDIEVISPDWLGEMAAYALQPRIGAVGAKLWYPDDTLQHGGIILGIGGIAGHSHKNLPRNRGGYFSRADVAQDLSAVTAACLVIRKEVFEAVGGFNETALEVAFNDVDLCLRIGEAGYRNVWTPYAELYHHESASRGFEDTPEKLQRFSGEIQYMLGRWDRILHNDPAYSPNLTLSAEDFSLAWPPRTC